MQDLAGPRSGAACKPPGPLPQGVSQCIWRAVLDGPGGTALYRAPTISHRSHRCSSPRPLGLVQGQGCIGHCTTLACSACALRAPLPTPGPAAGAYPYPIHHRQGLSLPHSPQTALSFHASPQQSPVLSHVVRATHWRGTGGGSTRCRPVVQGGLHQV